MKLKILSLGKTETGSIDLPKQFYEPIRIDLIQKAFLVIQSNNRQPYGSYPEAGKRASAELSRRRRKYRGSYGFGISRVPRKILSRRGTRMNWVGAFAPGTVGGRRAHPPKAEKIWSKNINKKERQKAIRSGLAATLDVELVKKRGHIPPQNYPFIIVDDIDKITQTKSLKESLEKIGFADELKRAKNNDSKGLLLVSAKKGLKKICANIPGFEVETVSNLNMKLLAPGGVPGRLTIFTQSAINELNKTKLFTTNYKSEKEVETKKKFNESKKPKELTKSTKDKLSTKGVKK
ncbi:MAG: 50S ribosomal protein L4 [Nanoarchaeota archaeon]|nr:50S ribosomal protein L4 [Nanoarchaeota archaeon]MBU1855065.1 50S ribosomal protein L4 [Nanoarchaeota archaeon]